MRASRIRHTLQPILIAALLLACQQGFAAEPPRVMFVSAEAAKPILIDSWGQHVAVAKGVTIQPGFTLRVPAGATLQIMTAEHGVVAVRPESLVKFESFGDGARPYRLKLSQGGVRIANSEQDPRRFEVATPNAQIKFDKGDHEAFYLWRGKLTDGRWGTFVRSFKDDSLLRTADGDLKVTRREIGYVPGGGKEKAQLVERSDAGGKGVANPVSYVPGAREIATTELVRNFDTIGAERPLPPSGSPPGLHGAAVEMDPFAGTLWTGLGDHGLPELPNQAAVTANPSNVQSLAAPPGSNLKSVIQDQIKTKQITLIETSQGPVPVTTGADGITVLSTQPNKTINIPLSQLPKGGLGGQATRSCASPKGGCN